MEDVDEGEFVNLVEILGILILRRLVPPIVGMPPCTPVLQYSFNMDIYTVDAHAVEVSSSRPWAHWWDIQPGRKRGEGYRGVHFCEI